MDLLSDILSKLKLSGTLYFRTSFTSPWSIKVPSFEKVSRFHFVHRGRCLVRIDDQHDPVLLEQGDLILICHGASHVLFCDPKTENQFVQLEQVLEESGFTGEGTLVYGEPDTHHETQLICGHFSFDPFAQHALVDALPSHIHIKNYGETAGSWMENSLKIIGTEAGKNNMGSQIIAHKMSEIIYAQAMRTYLENEGSTNKALAGFSDPSITRALVAIHQSPQKPWSLEELAKIAGLSRTSLSNKFTQFLSIPPHGYITQWRMQLARQKLLDSNASIIEIAEGIGYQSEAAFGRVFKKHFEIAPATFRRMHKNKQAAGI